MPATKEGPADRKLIAAVRRALREAAIPEKAGPMQAYMKSTMPYHGVPAPAQARVWREVFAHHPLADPATWSATFLELWRGATRREERYGAIALSGWKPYLPWMTLDTLPQFEEMIITGAWWDYVDTIAGHRIGELLRRHPKEMKRTLLKWSRDEDMWKRRTSILAQLGFKRETDLELLYAVIEPNLGDKEFFIRKAIGWALRQHAWTDPDEVRRYVRAHESRLSPLSRREALKNLG